MIGEARAFVAGTRVAAVEVEGMQARTGTQTDTETHEEFADVAGWWESVGFGRAGCGIVGC